MKLFKLFNFSKKNKSEGKKSAGLSGFLLHASEKEKHKVFTEAARMANEEQRETFSRSRLRAEI